MNKKLFAWALLAGVVWMVGTGCATLNQSRQEHAREWRRIRNHERLALADDFDLLVMKERNTRLTRWHDR